MEELRIFAKYLFPAMLQIIIVALIAFALKKKGLTLGYDSAIGVVLIVLAGVSSAFCGIVLHGFKAKSIE